MGRPSASVESKRELAQAVTRVLESQEGGRLSYRDAALKLDGVHFSTIANMAGGQGASPEAARAFARGFGEDEEYFGALASGVPSRMLRSVPGATMDALDRLGVRIDSSLLASIRVTNGEITGDGRLVVVGSSSSLSDVVGGQVEAIRVSGSAMAPAIGDGDIILVRRADRAEHGQIVVATVGATSVYVRVLDTASGKPFLKNPDGTLMRDRFRISGVVVAVVRTF